MIGANDKNRGQKSPGKKITKSNNGGRRKLDFCLDKKRPLYCKKIFLDIPNGARFNELVKKIESLGGKVEDFLSKEISMVVTNQKINDRMGSLKSGQSPSPLSPYPSPMQQLSNKHAGRQGRSPFSMDSPYSVESTRKGLPATSVSRGKNVLSKVLNSKKGSGTPDVAGKAKKLGAQLYSVDEFMDKYLRRSSTSGPEVDLVALKEKERRKSSSQLLKGSRHAVAHIQVLKLIEPFFKCEIKSRHFRPIFYEVKKWPKLYYNKEGVECPFTVPREKSKHGDKRKVQEVEEEEEEVDEDLSIAEKSEKISEKEKEQEKEEEKKKAKEDRGKKTKDVKEPAQKVGYCDCCCVRYHDLKKHLRNEKHRRFARDDKNYKNLDDLIGKITPFEEFLEIISSSVSTKDLSSPTDLSFDVTKAVDCTPNQDTPLHEGEELTKICDKKMKNDDHENGNKNDVKLKTNGDPNVDLLLLEISEIKADTTNHTREEELQDEVMKEDKCQKPIVLNEKADLNENIEVDQEECEVVKDIVEPEDACEVRPGGEIVPVLTGESKKVESEEVDEILNKEPSEKDEEGKENLSKDNQLKIEEQKDINIADEIKVDANELIQELNTATKNSPGKNEDNVNDDEECPKLPSKDGEESGDLDTLVECSTEAYGVTVDTLKSDIEKSLAKEEALLDNENSEVNVKDEDIESDVDLEVDVENNVNMKKDSLEKDDKVEVDVKEDVNVEEEDVESNIKMKTKGVENDNKFKSGVKNNVNIKTNDIEKDVNVKAKDAEKDVKIKAKDVRNDVNIKAKVVENDVNIKAKVIKNDVTIKANDIEKDVNIKAKVVEKDVNIKAKDVKNDVTIKANDIEKDVNIKAKVVEKDVNFKAKDVKNDVTIKAKDAGKDVTIKAKVVKKDVTIKAKVVEKDVTIKAKDIKKDVNIKAKDVKKDVRIKAIGVKGDIENSVKTKPKKLESDVYDIEDGVEDDVCNSVLVSETEPNKKDNSELNEPGSTCSVNGVTISETSNIDKMFMQPMLDDSKSIGQLIIGDVKDDDESQESGCSDNDDGAAVCSGKDGSDEEWVSSASECGCGEIPKLSIKKKKKRKSLKLSKSRNNEEKKEKNSLLALCQGRSSTPCKIKEIQKNDLDFSLDSPNNSIKVQKTEITADTGFVTALTELPQLDKSESKENFSPICRKAKRSRRKDRTPGKTSQRVAENKAPNSPNDDIMKIFESSVEVKEQSPQKSINENEVIESSNPEIKLLKNMLDFESPVRQLGSKTNKKDKGISSLTEEAKASIDDSNPEISLLKNILDYKSPGRLGGLAILRNSNKENTDPAPVSKNKKKLVFDDAKINNEDNKSMNGEEAPNYFEFCQKLNTDIDANKIKTFSTNEEKSLNLSPIKECNLSNLENDDTDDVFEKTPVRPQQKNEDKKTKEKIDKQKKGKKKDKDQKQVEVDQKGIEKENRKDDEDDEENFFSFLQDQKKVIVEEKKQKEEIDQADEEQKEDEKETDVSLLTFIKTSGRRTVNRNKERGILFQESEKERKQTCKKKSVSSTSRNVVKDEEVVERPKRTSSTKEQKVSNKTIEHGEEIDEKSKRTSSTKERKVSTKTTELKLKNVSIEEGGVLGGGKDGATKRNSSEKERGRKHREIPLDQKPTACDKTNDKRNKRHSDEKRKSKENDLQEEEEQPSKKREKRKVLSPEQGGRLRKRSRSNKDTRGSTRVPDDQKRSLRSSVGEPKTPSKRVSYKDRSDSEERSEDFVSDDEETDDDDKPMIFIKTPPTLKSPRLAALRVTYSIDKDAKKKRLYSQTSVDEDVIHNIINSPLKVVLNDSKEMDSDDYEVNPSSSMLFETKKEKPKRKLRPRIVPAIPNKSNAEDSDFEPSSLRTSPVRKKGRKTDRNLRDKSDTSEKIRSILDSESSFGLNSSLNKSKTKSSRSRLPGTNVEKFSKPVNVSKGVSPYDTSRISSRKKERNLSSPSHFDFEFT